MTVKERKLKLIKVNGKEIEYGYYKDIHCVMCLNEGIFLDMENESYTHDKCYCDNCNNHFELEVSYIYIYIYIVIKIKTEKRNNYDCKS